MNLAFKLHKTHENHAKNAKKNRTYQRLPNILFCLPSSKGQHTFSNLLKTKDKNSEFKEVYFCDILP